MARKKIITTIDTKTARSFLEKVVISAGVGAKSQIPNFEEKILPQIMGDIAAICGQYPRVTRAKKSIAGFKTRQGQIVGIAVTLRKQKAVDFFKRLITMVLPRVRDFGGIAETAIDQHGVLNIGLKEQYVFNEVSPEHSTHSFSLGIAIVPKQKKQRGVSVDSYRAFGVPFKK
jgi:large subunit ribosomal protein L5